MSEVDTNPEIAEAEETKQLQVVVIHDEKLGQDIEFHEQPKTGKFIATMEDKEGMKLVMAEFREGSTYAGLSYIYAKFDSVEDAISQYGEAIILKLINQKLVQAAAMKAKSLAPEAKDPERHKQLIEQLKATNPLLTQVSDILDLKPGAKRIGIPGLQKLFNQARKDGNKDEATRIFKLIQEEQLRQLEQMDDEDDDDTDGEGEE